MEKKNKNQNVEVKLSITQDELGELTYAFMKTLMDRTESAKEAILVMLQVMSAFVIAFEYGKELRFKEEKKKKNGRKKV